VLYAVLKPLSLLVLRWLCRHRAVGTEHVPRTGPLLLAANHVSLLDPPLVGVSAPRPLQFMAKAELFRIPLFGALIRRLNAYPVERAGADASALRHALLLLQEGKALLVFPEGTRGREGEPLRQGRPGTGMLVARSEAPVVPVYIQGSGYVLPRGARRPRRGPVTVRFGPPLRFERGRGKPRYQEITDRIMAAIDRLRAEAETGGAGNGHDPARASVHPPSAPEARMARAARPAGVEWQRGAEGPGAQARRPISPTGGTQEWNT
jgi:1-acyl-sn-glycerol-3-phosphate acyltransferase